MVDGWGDVITNLSLHARNGYLHSGVCFKRGSSTVKGANPFFVKRKHKTKSPDHQKRLASTYLVIPHFSTILGQHG